MAHLSGPFHCGMWVWSNLWHSYVQVWVKRTLCGEDSKAHVGCSEYLRACRIIALELDRWQSSKHAIICDRHGHPSGKTNSGDMDSGSDLLPGVPGLPQGASHGHPFVNYKLLQRSTTTTLTLVKFLAVQAWEFSVHLPSCSMHATQSVIKVSFLVYVPRTLDISSTLPPTVNPPILN